MVVATEPNFIHTNLVHPFLRVRVTLVVSESHVLFIACNWRRSPIISERQTFSLSRDFVLLAPCDLVSKAQQQLDI